ncbi:TetR/AcrR family transcriptional regulator [Nocardia sp. XZ_19_385]|uniref:TetR/AcrR family transcriptional regulator n=1 Tax=Nocardia sp. XZ_19_385 TaxID=2769488 RepID=UPI002815E30A|nr:TetR/AcrR family transcriptional regulator [Nocardia sp. XZ_19_385]
MVQRGAYSKGIAKREEILTAALDIVARNGYSRATVRELADAVGLSQTGLLHYFGTKEQLFTEILRRRDEVDQRFYGDPDAEGLPDMAGGLRRLVSHNAEVPGLVQLFSRFSSEAAEPGHPAHDFFRDRYATAREGIAQGVERLRQAGRLPEDLDADRVTVLMLAVMDGLQMQWLYDQDVDMAEHIAYFWRLLEGAGERGVQPLTAVSTEPPP